MLMMTMKGLSLSQSINLHPNIQLDRSKKLPITIVNPLPTRSFRVLSLAVDPSASRNPKLTVDANAPPLVVVGSANADIYVEIDRLPKEGETISAKTGQTLAGGKGANQAACGAKLLYPTYFVGRLGEDAHGKLIAEALGDGSEGCGVRLDYVRSVTDEPTGHAVVMLQSDGQNSIIIVGGANMKAWPETMSDDDLEIVSKAGIVLLQREIPDSINIQVAKVQGELKRLLELYKDEEVSITVTGHSLGAVLSILSAADFFYNEWPKTTSRQHSLSCVTVFAFGSPRIGDLNFKRLVDSFKQLNILRISNVPDLIPRFPVFKFTDVGEELQINTLKSEYLKRSLNLRDFHNLEAYLHGVAGTQHNQEEFKLEINRDIALVNKGKFCCVSQLKQSTSSSGCCCH